MRPHLEVKDKSNGNVTLNCRCICGVVNEVTVTEGELHAWFNGTLAQRAFPGLTNQQREYIMSGTCQSCWDRMFPLEED